MMKLFLKIKLKSLAAEARIIRKEEIKLRNRARQRRAKGKPVDVAATLDALHEHRIMAVRRESRLTHLAYGFLRGRSYTAMERKATTLKPSDWTRVKAMIQKYGGTEIDLTTWRKAA
jgi:hypothetical protein